MEDIVTDFFEKFRYKILLKTLPFWDRPLPPPTVRELCLVGEFRTMLEGFSRNAGEESRATSEAQRAWDADIAELFEVSLREDPREFLRWPVIIRNMFVTNGYYLKKELNYLRQHPRWSDRWQRALQESNAGHPIPSIFYPKSSGNLIHHAYHVAQFEDKTGEDAASCELIVEFGAGFGGMCRLLHQLGFKGKYILFDFPLLVALQVFYLKLLDLDAQWGDAGAEDACRSYCLYDMDEFARAISREKALEKGRSLFIATWSLSETSLEVRRRVLELVKSFDLFLVGYQRSFGEVNNIRFFDEWKSQADEVHWTNWEIDHTLGGDVRRRNFYLMGKRMSGALKVETR